MTKWRNIGVCLRALSAGLLVLLGAVACKPDAMQSEMRLRFTFTFEGESLRMGERTYGIASGERIAVSDIRYFVSDVVLVDYAGRRVKFEEDDRNVHYVSSDLEESLTWRSSRKLPTGVYDYVEFVYGLDSARNVSHAFRNPPESLMFWPEVLGGGYHYMQINGYWGDAGETACTRPFGLHTGIGTEQGEAGSVHFSNAVKIIDTLRFFLVEDGDKTLTVNMEVAEWFRNPHEWHFSQYGGSVMQNPEAQRVLRDNAAGVFEVRE
ncbi:MAG: hypothetical protein K2K11_01970 [Bacteroidales bacterium]|nr:hypothetical protein [Bacteroidales bacterium]